MWDTTAVKDVVADRERKLKCSCGRDFTQFEHARLECPVCGSTKADDFVEVRRPIYRVYLAEILGAPYDGEPILFSVSNVREYSLREEIAKGERLIKPTSLRLLYETFDRNLARSLATEL
ncbi:hypothetical protein [Paenibacillus sp. GXUN7292]|uniref:hypothetical protein n=1 Tax=Paenibacillus sp. GXUN7292 TaxID=3422499 RepID=UPI003D7E2670